MSLFHLKCLISGTLLFLAASGASSHLFAQSSQASLSGSVADTQGGAVAGARVTVTNQDTDLTSTTASNSEGLYRIGNLPVGMYTLIVEHEGFRRYERKAIVLSTDQALELAIKLELGAVNETVSVTGEVPLIETRSSDITQLIESKSIADLPLGNRRTLNVIALMGAAVFVGYANSPGNATPNFSLAGGRTQSQMFWIDGGSGQNMRLGVGQINLDPPVEAVDEIKVLSNNYSAEYGGSAGGVIVETTKSGTNRYHGSVYEYLRNDSLDAPGFFASVQNGAKVKPELRYNVFGGTLGGPVKHDRTFFFFSYEGQRLRTGGLDTLTVPSDAQRSGDFSQTFNAAGKVVPLYDPATTQLVNGVNTRMQFPGNIIPPNRLDPVALKVLAYYPRPNRTPDNAIGANNFKGNYVAATPANFYMGKVDHSLGQRDRLSGRYLWNGGLSSNTSVYANSASDPRTFADNQQQYVYANWNRVVTPTTVNDVRFSYVYRRFHSLSAGLGGDYPAKLGLTGVSANAFPQFSPSGFSGLGTNAQERQQFPIEQEQFVDNFSHVAGRHALKFGVEARRSRNREINLSTASGAFGFSTQPTGLPGNTATGNGLATLLLGFPTSFTATQTQVLDRSSWYLAAFAQDDWTVSQSLTVNIGLRWETDSPIVDANDRMNGFDQAQINPVSGTPGVVKFLNRNGFRSTPYRFDGNNFGPRFGFAWKAFGSMNTVVRAGYGVFFSHPFDSGQPNTAALGFSNTATLNTPDNGLTAPFYLRSGVPVTPSAPTLSDSFGAVPPGANPNTSVTWYETNRATGYSQQFNGGIQRGLPGNAVVEVTFLGNLARKLPNSNLSLNQIPTSILGPAHSTQKDRPYPQFSDVQIIAPTLGVSNYYAGLVRLQKRYSRGLSLGATYTYSKFLANIGDPGSEIGNNAGPYSNFYNRRADYGPEANDIRHRLTLNAVYEVPLGTGRRWLTNGTLGKVVGGWSISNVTTVQTGAPFTVVTQTNSSNAFSAGAQRANISGNSNLPSDQRKVGRWFNTGLFSQPSTYAFGNEGVGVLRGARFFNMDFSLLRELRITEAVRVQLRGEFFNALNHTNLGLPGITFGSSTFGVISSSGSPRQIQVGARIGF